MSERSRGLNKSTLFQLGENSSSSQPSEPRSLGALLCTRARAIRWNFCSTLRFTAAAAFPLKLSEQTGLWKFTSKVRMFDGRYNERVCDHAGIPGPLLKAQTRQYKRRIPLCIHFFFFFFSRGKGSPVGHWISLSPAKISQPPTGKVGNILVGSLREVELTATAGALVRTGMKRLEVYKRRTQLTVDTILWVHVTLLNTGQPLLHKHRLLYICITVDLVLDGRIHKLRWGACVTCY